VEHTPEEERAVDAHSKLDLGHVVAVVFGQARAAATGAGDAGAEGASEEPLRARRVEGYFPFTSSSWELEVYWQVNWLELLGSGVVEQGLPKSAGLSTIPFLPLLTGLPLSRHPRKNWLGLRRRP